MGADFSDVRVHTDTMAAESAAAVQAKAYTVGNEIVFGQGAYSPGTAHGKHALAHELTHVIQQRGGGSVSWTDTGTEIAVSHPTDSYEHAAEANATQVMRLQLEEAGPIARTSNSDEVTTTQHCGCDETSASCREGGADVPRPLAETLLVQRDVDETEQATPSSSIPTADLDSQPDMSTDGATGPAAGQTDTGPVLGAAPVHYRFEIKAWIPFASVVDPEEIGHELAFMIERSEHVSNYASQYRGDGHSGYDGSFKVFQLAEFDWDGRSIQNFQLPNEVHFGQTQRDFSAVLTPTFGQEGAGQSRFLSSNEVATADHAVTSSTVGGQEVDLGMSSANPLTIVPAPNIDADYSFFISQDTFGTETVTVRWTTDFMPNHGYRVIRNGVIVKEHIVNALTQPPSAPELFIRLNSKSNGGADTFEPGQ